MAVVRAVKIIAIQFAGLHVDPLPLMIFVAHCYAARFGMRCFRFGMNFVVSGRASSSGIAILSARFASAATTSMRYPNPHR
jgi:hypothetical protein